MVVVLNQVFEIDRLRFAYLHLLIHFLALCLR